MTQVLDVNHPHFSETIQSFTTWKWKNDDSRRKLLQSCNITFIIFSPLVSSGVGQVYLVYTEIKTHLSHLLRRNFILNLHLSFFIILKIC